MTPHSGDESAAVPETEPAAGDPLRIPPVAARDQLEPHPEGGWYRRTYTSAVNVNTPGGERPAVTLIQFYLAPGEASAWHQVASDEIWLWHGPTPLQLQFGGQETGPVAGPVHELNLAHPRRLVPAGTWQRTLPGTGEVTVSCMVTPGFSFADWRLADPES